MRQMQKKNQKRKAEQPEAEVKDVRNEELNEEVAATLDALDCCLAEVEKDDLAERKAAKAEWDQLQAELWAAREIEDPHEAEAAYDRYRYDRNVWTEKYRGVVTMYIDCCGNTVPDFGDLE